ncbi:MAG TPA: cytochrome P450 [Arthrobacter sp.]|nr:cytochrome P450 [Arthrobacter sp.]
MTKQGLPAPIADWVTIPELYRDPFPIFERLRSEGGVHWVPAVNRYLVTSYDAVHATELDQGTFSADEEGSLMIRAMGHSMLRRDDPGHYAERKAWQPALRPGVVKKTWMPLFERNAERYLREFMDKGPGADLVWDFAAPYAAENLRAVIGLHNATQQDLQRWSQTMIDATGNYADDPVVWAKGEASFNEVDEALDEMLAWHVKHPDNSLLSNLLALPDYQMPLAAIRANVKMTIGGGLNEPRDAIGVGMWGLLTHPEQRRLVETNPDLWDAVFDETIRWVAPIGMYSRQTTRDVVLEGIRLPAGAKLGICILSANRDEKVWNEPAAFDISRQSEGPHLAFGKGVHVCLGAWVARAEVAAVALPKLLSSLPGLSLDPGNPPEAGGWVFRGMTRLPVTWASTPTPAPCKASPSIAIVGAGPSGCYTAQALRRTFPDAELVVIDELPTPYGLVRHGVAPDHQGTKAVSRQFARLFEKDAVRFVGSTRVGTDISLDTLTSAFDAVVLATGLHQDTFLDVPGTTLDGVHGAGKITRLLNSHPHEVRPAPGLGTSVALVGQGNVAIDVVRLLAKKDSDLTDSDIDDDAHARLTNGLRTIHVIGRSMPPTAKFDPVMLRELAELHGVEHIVHGVDEHDLAAATDPRSAVVLELVSRPRTDAGLRVEWWFGYSPTRINDLDGNRHAASVSIENKDGTGLELKVDSIITAIGFQATAGQQIVDIDDAARESGRIREGLYAAGWTRRGPKGTIPSHRSDSRQLAETIQADFAGPARKPGLTAIERSLASSTSYDGWLLIDANETRNAASGRVRRKISDLRELRIIAGSALSVSAVEPAIPADAPDDPPANATQAEPVNVVFATESGNAELVAEELATHLERTHDVRIVDLSDVEAAAIDPSRFTIIVCSTYGDGELPTRARRFHEDLLSARPDLSGLRYALFGLGDRSYAQTYSRGSEILDETLQSLGASRIGDVGRHDAAGRGLAPAVAIDWIQKVFEAVPASGGPR